MEELNLEVGSNSITNTVNEISGDYPGGVDAIKDFEIDSKYFKIDVDIDHARFHVVVDNIILMKRGEDGEYTDTELDNHIEKCASYRASFLSVAQLVQLKLQEKQVEYKLWMAKHSSSSKEHLINEKILKKEQGIPATLLGSVTEKDVNDYIIMTYEEEYKSHVNELNDLEYKSKLLFGFEKIMEQRANDLRKLADRRNKTTMRDSV